MSASKPLQKPKLRGYFHQEGFFVLLGASILMVARSSNERTFIASSVFCFGLLLLFGISAIYHRPHWEPAKRALWRRFDHAAIFVTIAGGFTPFCLLALPESDGHRLLQLIWLTAVVGVAQALIWVKAPKWFMTLFCLGMAWSVLPYLGQLRDSIGPENVRLLMIGGLAYSAGALCYAFKKPKLMAEYFGYHELFHVLTLVGSGFFFFVVYQLIH